MKSVNDSKLFQMFERGVYSLCIHLFFACEGLIRASVYKQCRTPTTSFSIANMTKPFRLLTSHHIPSVSLLKHHWNFQSGCNVIIILIFHLGKLRSRDGNFYKVTARDRGPHSPSMASKHLFPIPCHSVHRPIVPLPQQ